MKAKKRVRVQVHGTEPASMNGDEAREIRGRWGLRQSELAGALGYSTRAVESWEGGFRRVPEVVAARLRAALRHLEAQSNAGGRSAP